MTNFQKIRKIVALIILPILLVGLYFVFSRYSVKETYAVDPMTVTYDGHQDPDPVFEVTNMLPGDEVEKEINIANNLSSGSFLVIMQAIPTEETQEFADILEVIVGEVGGPDIYGGTTGFKTLQDLFDESNISLGPFPASTNRTFRIKVKFPFGAGNEYQEARVVFNLKFSTALNIELPPECAHLAGSIVNVVEGTDKSEKLHGTVLGDLILGYGGNDKIDASSSADCVVGGEGNDHIDSEFGDDVILAGPGNDIIKSGSGDDRIYGGDGNDKVEGGSGEDLIYGGLGNDDLRGDSDDDEIYGEEGNDEIRGGQGNDKLYGGVGNDTIHGGSGDDLLDGDGDTDNLHGNSGTDTCLNGEVLNSCEP